jgi:hypothetical protein
MLHVHRIKALHGEKLVARWRGSDIEHVVVEENLKGLCTAGTTNEPG